MLLHYLSFHAHIFSTTTPPIDYQGKSFGFSATKAPEYQLVKSYLSFCVVLLETWHHLDRERISVLSEILLETTVMIDFKCSSVKRDWLFVLLLFTREKTVHMHKYCRTLQSILTQRTSTQKKKFFWQVEIKALQFCFKTLLANISYHTAK